MSLTLKARGLSQTLSRVSSSVAATTGQSQWRKFLTMRLRRSSDRELHSAWLCLKPGAGLQLDSVTVQSSTMKNSRSQLRRHLVPSHSSHAVIFDATASLGRGHHIPSLILSAGEVMPNPSVKGTSCGKPQVAPYVER